jgi:hypothetical protein
MVARSLRYAALGPAAARNGAFSEFTQIFASRSLGLSPDVHFSSRLRALHTRCYCDVAILRA